MKWEDVSPLYMCIYIYIRRTRHWRDSQRRRRYIEEVDQEVVIRERVSKRCSSDIVVIRETYGRDRHHVITKKTSLRRRDIQTMKTNRIMYHSKNPSLTILDGVMISKWVRSISSVQCIITTIEETCPFHYFFCNVCRHNPELDEYTDWYQKMRGYTKVFERDKKKFVSSWKHVRISFYKMTTDMKDIILQRANWLSTSKRLRKIEIAWIDVMEQLEIMDVDLAGTEWQNIIVMYDGRNLTKWTRWYHTWNTVM